MSDVDPRLRAHLRIGEPSDAGLIETAFELVLRRPPDPEALEIALSRLGDERSRVPRCSAISSRRRSSTASVPLGEPGDHGWFRQDDMPGWTRLFTDAGYFVEEQEAYELGDEGWHSAPTFEPAGVVYGARGPAASAVLCAELSPRRLRRLVSPDGIRRTARRRLGPRYRRLRAT